MVEGLAPVYDYSKILKFFKREFNCNGSMNKPEQWIQLSGDHREKVYNFFVEEGICNEKNIKVHGN